jgi:hypothetical protein
LIKIKSIMINPEVDETVSADMIGCGEREAGGADTTPAGTEQQWVNHEEAAAAPPKSEAPKPRKRSFWCDTDSSSDEDLESRSEGLQGKPGEGPVQNVEQHKPLDDTGVLIVAVDAELGAVETWGGKQSEADEVPRRESSSGAAASESDGGSTQEEIDGAIKKYVGEKKAKGGGGIVDSSDGSSLSDKSSDFKKKSTKLKSKSIVKKPVKHVMHVELKHALEEMALEEKFTSRMMNGKQRYSEAEVDILMNQWRAKNLRNNDDDVSSDSG